MEYCRQDGFKGFARPVTAPRQSDDKGMADGTCHSPAHHSHRRSLLAIGPHCLGNAFGIPFEHFTDGSDSIVPRAQTCPAGCKNELHILADPFGYPLLDGGLLVRDDGIVDDPGLHGFKQFPDDPAAPVFALAGSRAVRTDEDRASRRRGEISFPITLPALFFDQADMADLQLLVHRLKHIIEFKRRNGDAGEYLHLDARPTDRLRLAGDDDPAARGVARTKPFPMLRRIEEFEFHLHTVDGDGMTMR
jgi:hypothetical protein